MKRPSRTLVLSGLAACLVALTACTPADGRSLAPSVPVSRPLDSYLPDPAADVTTSLALDILARECLRQYGFTVDRPVMPTDGTLVSRLREHAEAAFVSEAQASAFGFHPPQAPGDTGPNGGDSSGDRERSTKVPPAAMPVLNGWHGQPEGAPGGRTHRGVPVPKYGCSGEAEEELSRQAERPVSGDMPGGELDAVNFVLGLRQRAAGLAEEDPGLAEVNRQWSACYLEATGIAQPNPYAAANDRRWATPTATAEEKAAAVAHARCRSSAGFDRAAELATAEYEQSVADEHRDRLEAIREFYKVRVLRAEEVVSSSGG